MKNNSLLVAKVFQSTHSRGVRLSPPLTIVNYIHFNPRTHEECDGLRSGWSNWVRKFNPRTHEECDDEK